MRPILVALAASLALLLPAPAAGHYVPGPHLVVHAVKDAFGPRYYRQALRVSWCESRWRTTARNGQYLGLWQMGSQERRRYGHGPDPWRQARAAYRYFAATDFDWSPWECKP